MDTFEEQIKTFYLSGSSTSNVKFLIYFNGYKLDGITSWSSNHILYLRNNTNIDTNAIFLVSPVVDTVSFSYGNDIQSYELNGGVLSIPIPANETIEIPWERIRYYKKYILLYTKEDMTLSIGTFSSGSTLFNQVFTSMSFTGTQGTISLSGNNKILDTVDGVLKLGVPEKTAVVVFKDYNNGNIVKKIVNTEDNTITIEGTIFVNKIAFAMSEKDCYTFVNNDYTNLFLMWINYTNEDGGDYKWSTSPWNKDAVALTYQYFKDRTTLTTNFPNSYILPGFVNGTHEENLYYTYAHMPLYRITWNSETFSNMRGIVSNNDTYQTGPVLNNFGAHYTYKQHLATSSTDTSIKSDSNLEQHSLFNITPVPIILGSNFYEKGEGHIRAQSGNTNESNISYYDDRILLDLDVFTAEDNLYVYYVPPIQKYVIPKDFPTRTSEVSLNSSDTIRGVYVDILMPDIEYESGKLYRLKHGGGPGGEYGIDYVIAPGNEVKEEELDYTSTDISKRLDIYAWNYIKKAIHTVDCVYQFCLSPTNTDRSPYDGKWTYYFSYSSGITEVNAKNRYEQGGYTYFFGTRASFNVKNLPCISYMNYNSMHSPIDGETGINSIYYENSPFNISYWYVLGTRTYNMMNADSSNTINSHISSWMINGGFLPAWTYSGTPYYSELITSSWSSYAQVFKPILCFDGLNSLLKIKEIDYESSTGERYLARSARLNSPNEALIHEPILYPSEPFVIPWSARQDSFPLTIAYQLQIVGAKPSVDGFFLIFYFSNKKTLPLPHYWRQARTWTPNKIEED